MEAKGSNFDEEGGVMEGKVGDKVGITLYFLLFFN